MTKATCSRRTGNSSSIPYLSNAKFWTRRHITPNMLWPFVSDDARRGVGRRVPCLAGRSRNRARRHREIPGRGGGNRHIPSSAIPTTPSAPRWSARPIAVGPHRQRSGASAPPSARGAGVPSPADRPIGPDGRRRARWRAKGSSVEDRQALRMRLSHQIRTAFARSCSVRIPSSA